MNDVLLRTSLLDLLRTLGSDAQHILLGGGYGLYLKQLHLAEAGARTLIGADLWPAPRATADLDLLLPVEIVGDVRSMNALRAALDALHYEVVQGSEYLQFVRTMGTARTVKVDLLTAQLDVLKNISAISADDRRARPAAMNRPKLHAHPTDGALAIIDTPLMIVISGTLSDGSMFTAPIRIPHPFSYLLMKLTAYRDRRNDPDKELGRHHALDIFRIVAMLTELERDHVHANLRRFSADVQVQSCAKLVQSDFSSPTSTGVLAMRAHPTWENDRQLDIFLETLKNVMA